MSGKRRDSRSALMATTSGRKSVISLVRWSASDDGRLGERRWPSSRSWAAAVYVPRRTSRRATVGVLSTRLNGGGDVEPVPEWSTLPTSSDGTTDVDQECLARPSRWLAVRVRELQRSVRWCRSVTTTAKQYGNQYWTHTRLVVRTSQRSFHYTAPTRKKRGFVADSRFIPIRENVEKCQKVQFF